MSEWSGFQSFTEQAVSKVGTISGVYKLAVDKDATNVRVFYVGESENLRDRLLSHLSSNESNKCIKEKLRQPCYFSYIEVAGGRDARRKIEQEKLNHYWGQGDAECNEKNPT